MPLVTYLGKKDEMFANGYDFSDGPVEVPKTDKRAIAKFEGNRYFFIDTENNHIAPKFYVFDIEQVRLPNTDQGVPRFKKVMGSIKGEGFQTEKEAKLWIKANGGKLDQSHYIKPSVEGIADAPDSEPKKPEIYTDGTKSGVFKKKTDGTLYKKPEITFEDDKNKDKAYQWLDDEGKNPSEYTIMVK